MIRVHVVVITFALLCVSNVLLADEPLLPIVAPHGLNADKVLLGQNLFFEQNLSSDGRVSCASCHNLGLGGVDGLQYSLGVKGQRGIINTPTIFNAALNFRQFWNGRAKTLDEQINGPIESETEMGNVWVNVVDFLRKDNTYLSAFRSIYDDGVTVKNIRNALVAFERSLVLPNAPFDQYLQGDLNAISAKEKQGYALFKSYGCVACHQGAGVGGNMFQKFGVWADYFADRKGVITEADLGRFTKTHETKDKFVFKVPSLRMVGLTAPYFHDGSVATLKEAIKIMGEYQLGRKLPSDDVELIESFLLTLAGSYKGKI